MSSKSLSDMLAKVALLPLLGWAGSAMAGFSQLNMTRGATPISNEVYELHMLIFYICVAIGVVVFSVMFWSIYHHRKSRGSVAAQFHHSTKAEFIWTIIPVLILVGMAIPATNTLVKMQTVGDSEMTIKVTGYQWKWHYDYIGKDISFFSTLTAESNRARQLGSDLNPRDVPNYLLDVDNPVVVPVNTRIRFLTTAEDVIHSWWVPALGWKRDAIPGFINEMWTYIEVPGTYRGKCAELCGRDHAYMPIVLIAKEKDEYERWVAERQVARANGNDREVAAEDTDEAAAEEWTMDDLMAKGDEVYGVHCAACHQANGEGIPGAFPALKGGPISTGAVDDHINIVVHGKPGTAMTAFKGQLNDTELAAVVTYTRNAWGNDTGDTVQPDQIKAAR